MVNTADQSTCDERGVVAARLGKGWFTSIALGLVAIGLGLLAMRAESPPVSLASFVASGLLCAVVIAQNAFLIAEGARVMKNNWLVGAVEIAVALVSGLSCLTILLCLLSLWWSVQATIELLSSAP